MNFQDHKSALLEIKNICLIVSDEIYAKPLDILTGSSIGQHIRHIIEFYHCLLSQANKSVINYDLRKRNSLIEKSGLSSAQFIDQILDQFEELDSKCDQQSLQFENCLYKSKGKKHRILTSFARELAYCLDHCIHHQYFIKIGLHSVDQKHILHDEFGIAPSTLIYLRSNVHS